MTTHVCLLDSSPIPAITPLIDKDVAPESVVFVFTANFKETADRVSDQMKCRGIKVHSLVLPESKNAEEHKFSFMKLLDELEDDDVVLNASCGQRYVNLAAYEVFRLYNKSIFCVDQETDVINWIFPDGKKAVEISDSIKIRHYLAAYGALQQGGIKCPSVTTNVFGVCEEWATNGRTYQYAMRALNYLAKSAEVEELTSESLSSKQRSDDILNRLIDSLEELDYCERVGDKLKFSSEEARFFANGGWLENYVFAIVRRLRSRYQQIQDDGISIEVERHHKQGVIKNELDVGILSNNRLHLIECKTKKFLPGEGNSVIYKIDSLVELLGGVEAKGMIVSYLPLAKHEKVRARDLGVEVIDYTAINQLESRLIAWLFM